MGGEANASQTILLAALKILRALRALPLLAAFICCTLAAFGADAGPDEPVIVLEDGKTYRLINGEPITGRDVLDLVLEDHWDSQLQAFIEHILRTEEISAASITIDDAEVEAALQTLLNAQAKRLGVNPKEFRIEDIVKRAGVVGGVAALKRTVRENAGMLRLLQKEGKLPEGINIADPKFQAAMRERLDQRITEKGVVTDPKRLGGGEACRIGARSFSHDEVRAFIVDMVRSLPVSELKQRLDALSLERAVEALLKQQKLALTDEAREFHFSYFCRLLERQTHMPGRMILRQQLEKINKTPEQFYASRQFKTDAGITLIAKASIGRADLQAEFAAHPERYKRSENLIAHLLIRVLDPEGHPYTANWKAPGHDAVNNYVAKMREQQFAAAKPRIEALLAAARQDWNGTVKRASEDQVSARVNGLLGRIGPETVLFPPCDAHVRDAAVKLKPGEVSGPVRSDYGWHLLKCMEKQDVTFDEAAESVYLNLIQAGRRRVSEQLQNGMKIEDKF